MISSGGSNKLRVYAKDVNGNTKDTSISLGSINLNNWSHVTIAVDRVNNKIVNYINGILDTEFTGGDT